MKIPRAQAALAATLLAASAASALALTLHVAPLPSPPIEPSYTSTLPGETEPVPMGPRQVLIQIFTGRPRQADGVSVTTIFRESSFTVVAHDEGLVATEEELRARVGDLFSLDRVDSIGSSLVALPGGSALLDDGGREVRLRVAGRPVGGRAVRLLVTASLDGVETVSTSVIARLGRTVVLAEGTPREGDPLRFICLTPVS